MENKTINQTINFKVKPHELYETLMDSEKHSKFTESEAKISREVGDEFTVFNGYITGMNVELVQDKKIVQNWHGKGWPDGYFSLVTFELNETEEGTELVFTHTGIPGEYFDEISKGWQEHYWDKLNKFFENNE